MDDWALEAYFDAGTIQRGRQYYRAGRVEDVRIANNGRRITSRVIGRERNRYRTQINVSEKMAYGGKGISGTCSCYVGFNCKHVVATLLEVQMQSAGVFSRIPTAPTKKESASATNALNRWLQEFESAFHNEPSLPSAARETEQVLYVLQASGDGKTLEVHLKRARPLKKGGYGRPKKYNSITNAQSVHLQPVDEEIIAGLQFLNKKPPFLFSGNEDRMEFKAHPSASKWLEAMLKTERCFWKTVSGDPITWSDTKALTFQWKLLPNAQQKLVGLVENHPIELFVLDQLWYVNKIQKCCGIAKTDIPSSAVKKLLEIPQLPPEMTKTFSQKIKNRISHQQLLPRQFNQPIIKACAEPIPVMRLTVEPMDRPDSRLRSFPYHTRELPIAEISFDYEGVNVPFSFENTHEIVNYVKGDTVYAIKRNFKKEKAHLSELNDCMQLTPGKASEADKPAKLIIASIQKEEDFIAFALYTIAQLEANGWRVLRDHEAFRNVVFEEDVSWYSELDEESEYDYFRFKMGIVVDDEKINILPIIAQVLQSTNIEKENNLPDDRAIALPLPNGKVLSVPYSRIKPILNILVELYDTTLHENEAITLSKQQAALLFEIEKAFKASQLRWFGGEKLRRLGKKLSEFQSIKTVRPPKTFQATLRQYQQEGVNWLQFLREYQMGGILADDMGLGKTVQTLAHLSIEKNKRRLKKPSLIIAPTSLMVNWRREAERFAPHLKVLIYHGDHRHRNDDTFSNHDMILTTYALLIRDKETLLNHAYYYLILDEAQCIKNHKAKSTQIVQQLNAEHRLCMTGTPMENHLGELWSLFHFLMPGFLGDARQFKRWFRTPIEKHQNEERRQGLALRVRPFLLRRQKKAVLKELPEKTEILRSVELQGPERDLYESIRLSMEKKVREAIQKKGLARSHIIILDALLKLRQSCCHPRLLKLAAAKKTHAHSAKMTLLKEMLPSMVEEGRKILLFSQFTTMLGIIEEMLEKEGLDYVKLTGATKNRTKPIAAFQEGNVPIFLISLKAGGTGLNLTAADTVILYDPWWNPAVEDQATDRAHRIGQKKPVFIYKLLASGTVEETIQEMQQKKRQLIQSLFSEQNQGKFTLSSEDLKGLFKPLTVEES